MSTDLYARAKEIFQRASALPPDERAAFLVHAAGGDEPLRREVESWLSASDQAGSFLESSPRLCTGCDSTFPLETRFCPHCGQPLEENPRALVGSRLDNLYEIEELLGRGGMGAVYRARHALLGDRVAIKTLRKELSDSPSFLKRFQREGRAARAFRHPNAVTVHDLRATPTGVVYMVMEYIEGQTLRDEMRDRGPVSVPEAVELLEPIASVLDAAHAAGVVHRDLKPENVMVSRDAAGRRVLKVLDLGIAKLAEAAADRPNTNLTVAGQIMGTPHYMSPEQWGELARDGRAEIDKRADVYSLGVIAYELLTGRWPYEGRSLQEFRRAHVRGGAPLAHEVRDGVPPEAGHAVARALAKDREDRTPSAGAFVEELRRAATSEHAGAGSVAGQTVAHASATMAIAASETALGGSLPNVEVAAPVATPDPSPARRRGGPNRVAAAAAIALAGALGAAAIWWPPGGDPGTSKTLDRPETDRRATVPTVPVPVSVLEYAIELDGAAPRRLVSGREPVATTARYRLRFVPAEPGYLYLVGPNDRNVPTLWLATPAARPVAAGAPVYFPESGAIRPGLDVASDRATVIFSRQPLEASFATGRAGAPLSLDAQRALEEFREAYGASTATSTVERGDGETVSVATSEPSRPALFDVVIRYATGSAAE